MKSAVLVETGDVAAAARGSFASSPAGEARWSVDRTLSVGYGVVWDGIFERFPPCRQLAGEVLSLIEAGTPPERMRRDVRILDVGCGPGNVTLALAETGFTVVGVDPHLPLIELAREKRRARRFPNLAFQQGDLAATGRWAGTFDHVVNVHTLYVHPEPARLLAAIHRVLRPGGHAVLVHRTRRLGVVAGFRDVCSTDGVSAALRALTWLGPNAIFEAVRKRIGPHYWGAEEFAARLTEAGFTVLEMRRTFLQGSSVLAWVRKDEA